MTGQNLKWCSHTGKQFGNFLKSQTEIYILKHFTETLPIDVYQEKQLTLISTQTSSYIHSVVPSSQLPKEKEENVLWQVMDEVSTWQTIKPNNKQHQQITF